MQFPVYFVYKLLKLNITIWLTKKLYPKNSLEEVFEKVKEAINPYENPAEKYERASNFYHLIMGVWEIKANKEAIKMADLKQNEFFLDLAAGTGWVFEKLLKKAKGIAIDFSWNMCKQCSKYGNAIQANALKLPFKNKSFDVIFSSFLLDLLPTKDIQKALKEMRRVLKEDGRIVAVSLTKEGKGIKKMASILYELFYNYWPTIAGYRASSRPIYLKKEIEKAGFKITERKISKIPIFQFPVEIVVARIR